MGGPTEVTVNATGIPAAAHQELLPGGHVIPGGTEHPIRPGVAQLDQAALDLADGISPLSPPEKAVSGGGADSLGSE